MNLTDSLLRGVLVSTATALLVALFVALAKWRSEPLAARFEHALWTCVLVAMLSFAVPRITIHAGPPVVVATIEDTEPAATTPCATGLIACTDREPDPGFESHHRLDCNLVAGSFNHDAPHRHRRMA